MCFSAITTTVRISELEQVFRGQGLAADSADFSARTVGYERWVMCIAECGVCTINDMILC